MHEAAHSSRRGAGSHPGADPGGSPISIWLSAALLHDPSYACPGVSRGRVSFGLEAPHACIGRLLPLSALGDTAPGQAGNRLG